MTYLILQSYPAEPLQVLTHCHSVDQLCDKEYNNYPYRYPHCFEYQSCRNQHRLFYLFLAKSLQDLGCLWHPHILWPCLCPIRSCRIKLSKVHFKV